jgi:hypothetical protein
MPKRYRPPAPNGPFVGDMGALPSWWPNSPPPDPRYFLNQGGFYYVAMYGNAGVGRVEHVGVYFGTATEVTEYQDGAPGGMTGGVAFEYSCVWRRVKVSKPPEEPPPAAKRTWETLAASTRSSYRGSMRRRLGLTTEAQFKHYYETTPDLSYIRRHPTRTAIAKGLGRISFPRGGDADPPPWLISWRRS